MLGRLLVIYVFIAMFWALFDQTGSAWVQQAMRMDRRFLGIVWLPSQVQAVNALLVMLFIPLFNGFSLERCRLGRFPGLYGLAARHVSIGPLRRIGLGPGPHMVHSHTVHLPQVHC